jgi:hypothetical protein
MSTIQLEKPQSSNPFTEEPGSLCDRHTGIGIVVRVYRATETRQPGDTNLDLDPVTIHSPHHKPKDIQLDNVSVTLVGLALQSVDTFEKSKDIVRGNFGITWVTITSSDNSNDDSSRTSYRKYDSC